jgi:hypothetical protein
LLESGATSEAQALVKRCADAEPTEGRLWTSVSSKPKNWNAPVEQILEVVLEDVKKHIYYLKK